VDRDFDGPPLPLLEAYLLIWLIYVSLLTFERKPTDTPDVSLVNANTLYEINDYMSSESLCTHGKNNVRYINNVYYLSPM
jgi:hypothetical protein